MYQKLAYVVHLHRPSIIIYYELDILVKKRFSALRQHFQISVHTT